jgi:hypothetical protein
MVGMNQVMFLVVDFSRQPNNEKTYSLFSTFCDLVGSSACRATHFGFLIDRSEVDMHKVINFCKTSNLQYFAITLSDSSLSVIGACPITQEWLARKGFRMQIEEV